MKFGTSSFFGDSQRRLESKGLRASESTYQAELSLPRHAHAHAHFCLVLSGQYEESLAGATEIRGPMTLIYYPPNCPHAETHRQHGRHFLVEWDVGWVERNCLDSELPRGPVVMRRPATVFLALKAYRLLRNDGASSPLDLESALIALLGEIKAETTLCTGRAPRWLGETMNLLQNSFSANLSLTDFAEAVKVHPSHLARSFKSFTGCTVGEMRRQLQIDHACRRLVSGKDPLNFVACDAGFADQSHMTRSVHEATGFTPGGLRSATFDSSKA